MMAETAKILVLGAGSWGTALAILLARNGQNTTLWGNDKEHMAELQAQRQNRAYLPNVIFPNNLKISAELTNNIAEAEDILIVVPSHAFREVLERIKPSMKPKTRLCWATKGLENNTNLLLSEVAIDVLGKERELAIISGPSFAIEVAMNLPTAVTIAANNDEYAQILVNKFCNKNFRAYTNTDMIGVQIGGATKNVIAIAAGIADGLGLGANARAALVTRGISEINRLGIAVGGKRSTFMGLSGLGDLVLTCTDKKSRNYRFGYALAQGKNISQAYKEIGQVVEGSLVARQVVNLAEKLGVEMPISTQVISVLDNVLTPREAVQNLLVRKQKIE
jgi:glycerol-3-phosphate dehydrogenase (NAD(P)+)